MRSLEHSNLKFLIAIAHLENNKRLLKDFKGTNIFLSTLDLVAKNKSINNN